MRERELSAACDVLGVRHVRFLGYQDAELDRADPIEAAGRVALHITQLRPHVVVTFDPYGAYGHPDHIAVSQLALSAVIRASSAETSPGTGDAPHTVQKMYYMVHTERRWGMYERAFKALGTTVDGGVRAAVRWPDWAVTTTIDAFDHWRTVWDAVQCHRTQMAQYGPLARLTADDHRALWGTQEYYRAFSVVNGGRSRENDLFLGIR
jgi:LmbE family N-acetylglucosaminyl deacetylase